MGDVPLSNPPNRAGNSPGSGAGGSKGPGNPGTRGGSRPGSGPAGSHPPDNPNRKT